jgi:hypothetical protein
MDHSTAVAIKITAAPAGTIKLPFRKLNSILFVPVGCKEQRPVK